MQSRVAVLRQLAAELTVDNPSRISVVKRPPLWYDEQKWDVFLPTAGYRLCVATQEVDDEDFAPVDQQISLPPGRVGLELVQARTDGGWQVTVLQDDQAVMVVDMPESWDAGIGSSGGGDLIRQQEFMADEPVVLMRRRFMIPLGNNGHTNPTGPAAGVLLWIEKSAAAAPAIAP